MTETNTATKVRPARKVKTLSLLETARVLLAVIGGGLLLLLIIASYHFYRLSPQSLYEQAYVEYQLEQEGDYLLGATPVEKAYRAGLYDSVAKESKKVQGFTDQDYLLIGLAHMHRRDFSAAIEPLRLVNLWNESDFKQEGEFYLSLAYLRNKDFDKSLELMERIRQAPDHTYHDQITDKLIRNVRILKWR